MAGILEYSWIELVLLVVIVRETATEAGSFEFIAKPWDFFVLFANIEDLLEINCETNQPKANVILEIFDAGKKTNALEKFKEDLKQTGQRFTIRVQLGDGFSYSCLAQYENETISLDLGVLRITAIPRVETPQITPKEDSLFVEYGGEISVTCQVRGLQGSKRELIAWYRTLNGINVTVKSIDSSAVTYFKVMKKGVTFDVSRLSLKHANYTNVGEYYCDRTYKGVVTTSQIRIEIEAMQRPKAVILTSRFLVLKESKGFISAICNTSGSPRPRKAWYKDGYLVKSCIDRSNPICTLRIDKPEFPKHNGTFECEATNLNGTAISTFSVLVQVDIELKKPTKEVISKNTDRVNITCVLGRGNPLPAFHWQYQPYTCNEAHSCHPDPSKWQKVEEHPDLLRIINEKESSRLLLDKSLEEHYYLCIANNSFSRDTYTFALRKSGVLKSGFDGLSTPVIAAIVVAIAFSALLALSFAFWYRQKLKRKYAPFLAPNPNFQYDHSVPLLEQCTGLPYDVDWEFPRARLTMMEPIGSGAFGEVWLAEAEGILVMNARNKSSDAARRRSKLRRSLRYASMRRRGSRPRPGSVTDDFIARTEVAVKTLKDDASPSEYKDLASELKILIHLGEHNNIVNLLGACTQEGPLCVILEFCPNGNLLNFLRDRREIFRPVWYKNENSMERECTFFDLLVCAYQVARGMEFLAAKKCVHRDLAARNILVSRDYVMKIADFGLARDVYKDDFYWKSTGGLLPAKWMSPEALFDKLYTEQSDIWSFGILLWEIFTLGGSPYPGLQTEELFTFLQEGKRMDPPYMCPEGVYALMRECWKGLPEERPPFHVIVESLGETLDQHVERGCLYLNLQDRAESTNHSPDGVELHGVIPQGNNEYLKLKNGSVSSWDSVDYSKAKRKDSTEDADDSPFYSKLKGPKKVAGARSHHDPVVEYKSIARNGQPRVVRLDTQMSTISDEI